MMVYQERMDQMELTAPMVSQATKVTKEIPVVKVLLGHLENRAMKVNQDLLVHKARKVTTGHLVPMDLKENLGW